MNGEYYAPVTHKMAGASILLTLDQFICSICLDLLKDPVTLPCGHSYCMSCITDFWDQDDQKRVYSCPQCRQTFTPRPVLGKNIMLTEVVEKLKKTKLQDVGPDLCFAGPGDVECDVCTERKHKAVKSCLVCLSSYCQTHLEQHENLFKGKKHNLIDATALQDMICPQHEKLLEFYCRTDRQCICYLCMAGKHKHHDTVLTESNEKQKEESQKLIRETLAIEQFGIKLDRFLQDKVDNQTICDWIEANLDEWQIGSEQFVRALMTSVCQSAIIRTCTGEISYKLDLTQCTQRANLLSKYLCDETKELRALYALQALMVKMEQPKYLLRVFFDYLYDEDIIKEEVFFKWESSKDPAEMLGKVVALKSVSAFFLWLREAEEESDGF